MGEGFAEEHPHMRTVPYKTLPDGKNLLLDVYTPARESFPNNSRWKPSYDTTPVVLFFHAGGLTADSRKYISPSRIQASLSRGWTFVSADYRLLPQATAQDILEDVRDAYEFVVMKLTSVVNNASASRGREAARKGRKIIVAGASAGSYLAFLTARYYKELSPPPVAILSYYGIPSFRGPFYNTNHVIFGDEPLPQEQFQPLLDHKEVFTGYTPPNRAFDLASLNQDLTRNIAYKKPELSDPQEGDDFPRHMVYDYYVQKNIYPKIFNEIEKSIELGPMFPKCILLHGNADPDGPHTLSEELVKEVGEENAKLIIVDNVGHCFDEGFYLEDEGAEMKAVKDAWGLLDDLFDGKWK